MALDRKAHARLRPARLLGLLAALVLLFAGAGLTPRVASAGANLAERAFAFAEDLVALRNERVSIGLRAEGLLTGQFNTDPADAVLRRTAYAVALERTLDQGQINLALARRALPAGPQTPVEHLLFDEVSDPFLLDALQLLQPELAGTLLRLPDLSPAAQQQVLFDYLLSTVGTGGSYTIPISGPAAREAVDADGVLLGHLLNLQRLAKSAFEARANAPLALKAFPDRIPEHWRRFVGVDSASARQGGSGLRQLEATDLAQAAVELDAIERALDLWQPMGCLGADATAIRLSLLDLIRVLERGLPALAALREGLSAATSDPRPATAPDPLSVGTLATELLTLFNAFDQSQVSRDSDWLAAGADLSRRIDRACRP